MTNHGMVEPETGAASGEVPSARAVLASCPLVFRGHAPESGSAPKQDDLRCGWVTSSSAGDGRSGSR